MKKKIYLSIIIPAYNEESKIEKDVKEAFAFFKKNHLEGEVIVSTDGVTDNTNKIVRSLQKQFPNLTLLWHKNKIGKGAAIKRGVAIARGEIIMFADAGYCVPFKFINSGIEEIKRGADLAIASRLVKNSQIVVPQALYRRIGSKIFGIIVRRIITIPDNITDTQCGFKLYKRSIAKRLFSRLETPGFMFDIELILRATKYKFKIAQFPVDWQNDSDTKFNPFSGTIADTLEILKIKSLLKL